MRARLEELIRFQDEFYILASSSRIDDRTRVLKHADTFAVFDRFGDIAPVGFGELGLYHDGTRFLSRLALTFDHRRPLLLGSTVTEDSTRLAVDLTNPDLHIDTPQAVPRGSLYLSREMLLWQGVCYQQLRIGNYGRSVAHVSLGVEVDADFADIFEVRGMKRARTGTRTPPTSEEFGVRLGYRGLDGVQRQLAVRCSERPAHGGAGELAFEIRLEPHQHKTVIVAFVCERGDERPHMLSYEEALGNLERALAEARHGDCIVTSSNELFNDWVHCSISDLHMMVTETPHGPYPYAGAPWFSTPFGRDGLITALETLWVNPAIARGVLSFLAAYQADRVDTDRDAQPGKILHEARGGEMAALGEVPFGRYYGSVDSTPLFVMLAGAYYRRTGDLEFIRGLWPNVQRALHWMEHDGDPDGDGFLEYARRAAHGLVQQGWKDSFDAVFHADGSLAEPPIALCEVQGYAYAAYRAAAGLARALGLERRARPLLRRAAALRDAFEQKFWCEEIASYALALDGAKQPCRVRTSNAGHCLYTGIARSDRAARVMNALMCEDCFSGSGIRTASTRELRYNPMSYHNGSVWPHDNALIAAGFARYGFHDAALRVLTGLFEVSTYLDMHRMPELFCGFPRRAGSGPTLYPVACAPQSWAAASVFMLLGACLGLSLDGTRRRISMRRPVLPEFLEDLHLRNLCVGDASVDLRFERHGHDVGVNVVYRRGDLEVMVLK